jgi:preprotein translocase subunit SecE
MVKSTLVKQVLSYFSDVKFELSKVTWPKREEVVRLTLVVFIISAVVAIYVGALDYVFTKVLAFVVSY